MFLKCTLVVLSLFNALWPLRTKLKISSQEHLEHWEHCKFWENLGGLVPLICFVCFPHPHCLCLSVPFAAKFFRIFLFLFLSPFTTNRCQDKYHLLVMHIKWESGSNNKCCFVYSFYLCICLQISSKMYTDSHKAERMYCWAICCCWCCVFLWNFLAPKSASLASLLWLVLDVDFYCFKIQFEKRTWWDVAHLLL